MTTVEGTSPRRHGRRARALEEDANQHRPTGNLAFFARRTVVAPPAADSPLPKCTRFDLSPFVFPERDLHASEPVLADDHESKQAHDSVEAVEASSALAELDPASEKATAEEEVAEEASFGGALADIPASDLGAKKSSWLGSVLGFSRQEGEAGAGELTGSADAAHASVAEGTAESELTGVEGSTSTEEDASVYDDTTRINPVIPATAVGVGSVAAGIAGTRDAQSAEEQLADDDSADSEAEAWTEEPDVTEESPLSADDAPTERHRLGLDEEKAPGANADWYEIGDLPADQAPEPKSAPRFEGQALNKPSRSSAGLGGWVTWIVVFIVLAVIVALLVTGKIGPGLLNSQPATTTHSILNAGGLLL